MKKLLFALPLLFACDGPLVAQPEADNIHVEAALCRLGFRAITMRTLATGHHVVDVTVNGKPAVFILDTGASATVIHAPAARDYGIGGRSIARGGAYGLGGGQATALFPIDSFAVGGMPTRLDRIATLDLGQFVRLLTPLAGQPVVGIIGQDLMVEHRAVIDVSAPAVHLMEEDADPAPDPNVRCG